MVRTAFCTRSFSTDARVMERALAWCQGKAILNSINLEDGRERFEKVFFDGPEALDRAFDRREVLLITALLFASMPALHYDAPRRQLAMACRALELFDEALRPETEA